MKLIYMTMFWVLLVLGSLIGISCSKSDMISTDSPFTINVRLASDELESGDHVAKVNKAYSADLNPSIILAETRLNDDYYILTELMTLENNKTASNIIKAKDQKASIIRNPILRHIRFRILVYDGDGNFHEDKMYTINSAGLVTPDDRIPLSLDRGQYSFVAYSYNNTDIPSEDLKGTTINDQLVISPIRHPEFMMFRSGVISVGPNSDNNLNIAFKYRFSPITLTIDASATNGYEVSSIGDTRISPAKDRAYISLSSDDISYGASDTTRKVSFPIKYSDVRTSNITWVANKVTNASLTIGSLRIGPLLQSTPIVLNNIMIRPGVGYHLKVRILPNDRYETISGEPAALINGKYWMRRNIGAKVVDPDSPDATGSFQALIGNYYQWGRPEVRATSYTGPNADESAAWNSSAKNGAWYSSTGNGGKVDANDPCPLGWRIPTKEELVNLTQNTTQLAIDNRGENWSASPTNFSTAKVFRSKRNKNIILTFPSGGYYDPSRTLNSMGNRGYYWTSTETLNGERGAWRMYTTLYNNDAYVSSSDSNRSFAFNVRCIRAVY